MSFRLPTRQEKSFYVHNQFERIARRYDLTNDVISLGMHRLWKASAVDALAVHPGGSYLDLCCGTGDLALLIARRLNTTGSVTAVDFSPAMLEIARRREGEDRLRGFAQISWTLADAQKLPFPDNSFDGALISFGLRNLTSLEQALREMARVVKTDGHVVNLDVGHVENSFLAPLFRLYFGWAVPLIGDLIQGDKQAYTYLPESARLFPPPGHIATAMHEAGLSGVVIRNFAGGAASMQVGTKL